MNIQSDFTHRTEVLCINNHAEVNGHTDLTVRWENMIAKKGREMSRKNNNIRSEKAMRNSEIGKRTSALSAEVEIISAVVR